MASATDLSFMSLHKAYAINYREISQIGLLLVFRIWSSKDTSEKDQTTELSKCRHIPIQDNLLKYETLGDTDAREIDEIDVKVKFHRKTVSFFRIRISTVKTG